MYLFSVYRVYRSRKVKEEQQQKSAFNNKQTREKMCMNEFFFLRETFSRFCDRLHLYLSFIAKAGTR